MTNANDRKTPVSISVPDRKGPGDGPRKLHIRIDRKDYEVPADGLTAEKLTGAEIRRIAESPIPADRDLFGIVPGAPDRKIGNDDAVGIRDGMRFFSAPATINPGIHPGNRPRRRGFLVPEARGKGHAAR